MKNHITFEKDWRDSRVVEEARLESVYTPKAYRGFESRSLRINLKGKEKEIINY